MSNPPVTPDTDLALATTGDRPALQRLLLRCHARLRSHISRRLPTQPEGISNQWC